MRPAFLVLGLFCILIFQLQSNAQNASIGLAYNSSPAPNFQEETISWSLPNGFEGSSVIFFLKEGPASCPTPGDCYSEFAAFAKGPATSLSYVAGNTMSGKLFTFFVVAINTQSGIAVSPMATIQFQGGTVNLHPGNGFFEPTVEPPPVGSGAGVEARAIAKWDVVPFQVFQNDFSVGVVAFHRNEIERVDFSLENGKWESVSKMTFNPRTGVTEYWANIPGASLPDGNYEVRAIVYPKVGTPRVLAGMNLYNNSGNSLVRHERFASPNGSDSSGEGTKNNPFKTVYKAALAVQDAQGGNAGGGFVSLLPGDYEYGQSDWHTLTASGTWLTVRPAAGTSKQDVRITSTSNPGLSTHLVKLENLTLRSKIHAGTSVPNHVWLDGCDLIGNGQETDITTQTGWLAKNFADEYFTHCVISDNAFGEEWATLQRNVDYKRMGSDILGGTGLVVNCTVDDVDRGSQTGWHPDLWDTTTQQSGATAGNFIVYGLRATNLNGVQGIYIKGWQSLRDVAIVNVLIEKTGGDSGSQIENPVDHLVMQHCTFVGQTFKWRTPESTLSNLSVVGNCFQAMKITAEGDSVKDEWFDHNHYVDTANAITPGVDPSHVSTGDPGFSGSKDFHPKEDSVLKNRLSPKVPVDLDQEAKPDPGSVGAFE